VAFEVDAGGINFPNGHVDYSKVRDRVAIDPVNMTVAINLINGFSFGHRSPVSVVIVGVPGGNRPETGAVKDTACPLMSFTQHMRARNPEAREPFDRAVWERSGQRGDPAPVALDSPGVHRAPLGGEIAAKPDTIRSHILVVDDDRRIRELLEEYLTQNDLRVSVASSGRQMSQILSDEAIDLVILDLRLAGEDGMAIARTLRDESAIPIVMLTGVRDEADRIMGLELGADDYLTKPFSPRELLARIRTVLRRTRTTALEHAQLGEIRAYTFDRFELNLRTRRLTRGNRARIDLTNGEFNLLAALLAAPQRILTRDQLLEASRVYGNEVYDRSIDVQILRLRRKIEIDPSEPKLIVTERGTGYTFNAAVEILY
jgi:two-component system OmpR family response regulator